MSVTSSTRIFNLFSQFPYVSCQDMFVSLTCNLHCGMHLRQDVCPSTSEILDTSCRAGWRQTRHQGRHLPRKKTPGNPLVPKRMFSVYLPSSPSFIIAATFPSAPQRKHKSSRDSPTPAPGAALLLCQALRAAWRLNKYSRTRTHTHRESETGDLHLL